MLLLLLRTLQPWLEDVGLWKFVRVFNDITFRAPLAMILAFFACLIFGPRVIAWLRGKKIGDLARFDQAEVDRILGGKSGTPTMGGVLMVAAIGSATLLLGDLANFYTVMALVCLLWMAGVGIVDDWLKLTAQPVASGQLPVDSEKSAVGGQWSGTGNPDAEIQNPESKIQNPKSPSLPKPPSRRQGLHGWEKLLAQLGLGVVLAFFTHRYGGSVEASHTLYFPFLKDLSLPLGLFGFMVLATIVITATSNAVNLTDGLDGLAAGCSAIVAFTLFILAIVIGHGPLASYLRFPHFAMAGEMAVLAAALTGACLGFLWFNCHPAQVFMGDTGSLALGGLIGYIAIVIRQELLLILLGGVFVIEAGSVLIQVSYFKYSRRRYGEGRRIFLMSPIHLHFVRKGWKETQVVVRFWLIGAMLAALTLATIKLR